MSDECAKPGDIIEITWDNKHWLGKKFTVIARHQEKSFGGMQPGDAWFINESGRYRFFGKDAYKIVERKEESKDSDRDVDRFLNDQRDAIFRRMV